MSVSIPAAWADAMRRSLYGESVVSFRTFIYVGVVLVEEIVRVSEEGDRHETYTLRWRDPMHPEVYWTADYAFIQGDQYAETYEMRARREVNRAYNAAKGINAGRQAAWF